MNLDRLHVMFGMWDLADHYNQHIGVTITSLAINCSLPVTVHLLYDENLHKVSPEYLDNQEKYRQLGELYDVEVCYHHIELPESVLRHPGAKAWNPAAYLRLFAPDLLSDIDWILYLDGDITVTCDLADIWNQEWWCENFAVAAVLDTGIFNWPKSHLKLHKRMNIFHENYFNSGFLLMNLKKIRIEYTLRSTTEDILRKYPELPYPDQDVLNIIFSQDVMILPEKYDNFVILYPDNDYTNCCIHFVCGKPWVSIEHPASLEYWRYLAFSPWGNTSEKYLSSVEYLISRVPLDEVVLTGRIPSLRKFLCNLVRRGWKEFQKKLCR